MCNFGNIDEAIQAIKNQYNRVISGLIPFAVNRLGVVENGCQGGYLIFGFGTWNGLAPFSFLADPSGLSPLVG